MPSTRSVLVVESEPALQLTVCATLMRMGVTAHRAASVDAALGILASTRVNTVVLSAQVAHSLDLVAFLRATSDHAHVRVLLYTSEALSPVDADTALRNGAEVFLTPYEYRGLLDRVVGNELDAVRA